MKFCTSPTDAIARYLLIEYGERDDLGQAEKADSRDTTMEQQVREMID